MVSQNGAIVIGVVVVLVVVAIVLACVFGIPKSSSPTPTTTATLTPIPTVTFIPPTPPDEGIPIGDQPHGSVQIINTTSQNPLSISLQLDPNHESALWTKSSGDGTLGSAVFGDDTKNPPNYQLVTLGLNETIVMIMPDYTQPFRITPLGNLGTDGMPILVEGNKSLVFDMSAVDGANYLLSMQLTADVSGVPTVIDFNTNPCPTSAGCRNPSVDGEFLPGTTFSSAPCPYGTCNLAPGPSREWAIHVNGGQCSNVTSTWESGSFAAGCMTTPRSFTTYAYSHSDTNSSPTLLSPFQVKLRYADLA